MLSWLSRCLLVRYKVREEIVALYITVVLSSETYMAAAETITKERRQISRQKQKITCSNARRNYSIEGWQ